MHRIAVRIAVVAILGAAPGFLSPVAEGAPATAPAPRASFGPRAAPTNSGCFGSPTVTSTIPADMAVLTNQADANCFAWQQFIGLNWPADPATCAADPQATPADFGTALSTATVVWETYKESSEVFQPSAGAPSPWCSKELLPAALAAGRTLPPTSPHGYQILDQDSKFSADTLPLRLGVTTEAGTGGAWLTAQNGLLTEYEIRMNQDEFNYIDRNKLYDARVQQGVAGSPGIGLPDGSPSFSSYGSVGSIELKAAWIELDNPALWPSFKISRAVVVYPGQPPKEVTVGLVGLHIIHKTVRGQQFVWATFEHVANDPSVDEIGNPPRPTYTYYDANCNKATDHYHCAWNAEPSAGVDPYQAPVQVVRMTPISSVSTNNIAGLNQFVWNQIAAVNPTSTFLNYELVSTMWPNSNTPIPPPSPPPPGCRVPLPFGDSTPNKGVMNTTLETYFQTSTEVANCLSCHMQAPIATVSGPPGIGLVEPRLQEVVAALVCNQSSPTASPSPAAYAADYSFLFHRARASPRAPSSSGGTGVVVLGSGVAAALLAAGTAVVLRRRGRRAQER